MILSSASVVPISAIEFWRSKRQNVLAWILWVPVSSGRTNGEKTVRHGQPDSEVRKFSEFQTSAAGRKRFYRGGEARAGNRLRSQRLRQLVVFTTRYISAPAWRTTLPGRWNKRQRTELDPGGQVFRECHIFLKFLHASFSEISKGLILKFCMLSNTIVKHLNIFKRYFLASALVLNL